MFDPTSTDEIHTSHNLHTASSICLDFDVLKVRNHTVDGRDQAFQLRLVVYPSFYKVLAPSGVVVWDFFHQQ